MTIMRKLIILITLSLLAVTLHAQEECSERYRSKVFKSVAFTGNIDFDAWIKHKTGKVLRYDVYEPKGDTAALRPLVILWHGGAYVDALKRNSPDIVMLAKDLAKMGYVVISAEYRRITNLLDFLNEEKLIKHVIRATLDANDAVCHILSEIDNGNPFRINRNEIFAGGVSAGAVSGLHGIFINTLDDLGPKYAKWARQVDEGRADAALANRFCTDETNIIKGLVSISGAILDTSFIKYHPTKALLIHGDKDDVLYFDVGQPLGGFTAAPDLYGSKPIYEKFQSVGIESEMMVFKGRGHVPFMNLDLPELLDEFHIFNYDLYDETLEGIIDFIYPEITCELKQEEDDVPTGLFNRKSTAIQPYPNPANSSFQLRLPETKKWQLSITDLSGRIIQTNQFYGSQISQDIQDIPMGMYIVHITEEGSNKQVYFSKLIKEN